MQRNKERIALYFDVKLEASSTSRGEFREIDGLVPRSLEDLTGFLQQLVSDPDRNILWPKNSRADILYLADMHVDEDRRLILLVNRCDPRAADSVFFDPETRTRTLHEKKPGEGLDHSSHVVVSLDPFAPHMYRAVIEMCPGLSSARLEAYINFLLKECAMVYEDAFMVDHTSGAMKNGKPVRVRIKHKCKMMGHISPEFEQELEAGTLGDIELIRLSSGAHQWDSAGSLIEKAQVVRIRESSKGAVDQKLAALKDLCGVARQENFDQVRVTFKSEDGLTRTAKIDPSSTGLAHDSKYIKKVVIGGFTTNLPTSFDSVNHELKSKLCALL
ncbi:hypothetical protein M6D76_08680 [Alcaligenes faecalis]|uniref:hypothetical protein n=1 Tax=Alcaligenes faecalis TaxID=511 RepID=UPI00211CB6C0|nr:hypothetical protein [Alcaligenes faecalis]UUO12736.1 hypothetical protein M6D76_08680 [Alcaligenes faecalis]